MKHTRIDRMYSYALTQWYLHYEIDLETLQTLDIYMRYNVCEMYRYRRVKLNNLWKHKQK